MVALATPSSERAANRMSMRWFDALVCGYVWLKEFMPTIGKVTTKKAARGGALWLHAGGRFRGAVAAQQMAESYYQRGELTSAVGVLTDAAARFSEGRFPATAVELLQKITDDDFSASALRTVAQKCLKHGDRKHLVAAVRLLGMAYERDRTDTHALELLSFAFEKMGLEDKARKVNDVRAEISEAEHSSPAQV